MADRRSPLDQTPRAWLLEAITKLDEANHAVICAEVVLREARAPKEVLAALDTHSAYYDIRRRIASGSRLLYWIERQP